MTWIPGAFALFAAVNFAVAQYGVQQSPTYSSYQQPNQPVYQQSYQPSSYPANPPVYQPPQIVPYPVPGQPVHNSPAFTNVKAGRNHGPFFDAFINNYRHHGRSSRSRKSHHKSRSSRHHDSH